MKNLNNVVVETPCPHESNDVVYDASQLAITYVYSPYHLKTKYILIFFKKKKTNIVEEMAIELFNYILTQSHATMKVIFVHFMNPLHLASENFLNTAAATYTGCCFNCLLSIEPTRISESFCDTYTVWNKMIYI
jgi:hypothetical protein